MTHRHTRNERMRVSTDKSEVMMLCWKKVDCLLGVGRKLLPQAKLINDGAQDWQADWCSMSSDVGVAWDRPGEERPESEGEALSINRSINIPTLTYGHTLWISSKMHFFHRVSRFSLRDKVRSSDIWRRLGIVVVVGITYHSWSGNDLESIKRSWWALLRERCVGFTATTTEPRMGWMDI